MKLKNIGRAALALAASAVTVFGMTSCSLSYTVGYMFVTGAQYNQVASYRIKNTDGTLRQTSITGSGGANPIQAVVTSGGNFLYVLNDNNGTDSNPQHSTISLFTIGGYGVLTFQASFSSQGFNTRNLALSGSYLYALDEFAPGGTGAGGTQSVGAITVFAIDPNTGRLTPQANQQTNTNGSTYYFPVGTKPIWMAVSGNYALVAEQGIGTPTDPSQAVFVYNQNTTTGQLTLTQSTPTPTGATQLTYVYSPGTYVYLLDAGPTGSTGFVLPYTVNASGTITPVAGAARANNAQGATPVMPSQIIKETSHNFLWVANEGINLSNGTPTSFVTGYLIQSTGQLADINNGGVPMRSGPGPRCIVEDPSNQYVYLANFDNSTISGDKIDQVAGALQQLPKGMPAPPGSPTWCTVTGAHF